MGSQCNVAKRDKIDWLFELIFNLNKFLSNVKPEENDAHRSRSHLAIQQRLNITHRPSLLVSKGHARRGSHNIPQLK